MTPALLRLPAAFLRVLKRLPDVAFRSLCSALLLPLCALFPARAVVRRIHARAAPFSGAFFLRFLVFLSLVAGAFPYIALMQFTAKDNADEFMRGVVQRDYMPYAVNVHRFVHLATRVPEFRIENGKLRLSAAAPDFVTLHDPVGNKAELSFRDVPAQDAELASPEGARIALEQDGIVYRPGGGKAYRFSYADAEKTFRLPMAALRYATDLPVSARETNLIGALNLIGRVFGGMPALDYTRAGRLAYAKESPAYKPKPFPYRAYYPGTDAVVLALDAGGRPPEQTGLVSLSADTLLLRAKYGAEFSSVFLPSVTDKTLDKALKARLREWRDDVRFRYWGFLVLPAALLAYASARLYAFLLAAISSLTAKRLSGHVSEERTSFFRSAALFSLAPALAFSAAFPPLALEYAYIVVALPPLYYIWLAYRSHRL
jgi:hypothetical protein